MNAERLHAVLKAVNSDFNRGVRDALQKVEQKHRAVMDQPTGQAHQELAEARNQLAEILTASSTNDMPPAWRDILVEIGGADLVGKRLLVRVDALLQSPELVATKHAELAKLAKEFADFKDAVDQVTPALSKLKIGLETIPAGAAEIGILIPRKEVEDSATDLGNELRRIDLRILRPLAEVVGGDAKHLRVVRLSSSAFIIDLVANNVEVISMIGATITWVLDTYQRVLEIRDLRREKSAVLPADIMDRLEEHANSLMDEAIAEKVPEMIKDHLGTVDSGRTHELTKAVDMALHEIAARIDRGYSFEVRVGPPPADDVDGAIAAQLAKLQSMVAALQYVRPEGEPILALPDPEAPSTADSGSATMRPAAPRRSRARKPRKPAGT